jgi:hypothetical protein
LSSLTINPVWPPERDLLLPRIPHKASSIQQKDTCMYVSTCVLQGFGSMLAGGIGWFCEIVS